jgi:hypothetical protein
MPLAGMLRALPGLFPAFGSVFGQIPRFFPAFDAVSAASLTDPWQRPKLVLKWHCLGIELEFPVQLGGEQECEFPHYWRRPRYAPR